MFDRKKYIVIFSLAIVGLVIGYLIVVALSQPMKLGANTTQTFTLNVDGRERNYLVYVPTNFTDTSNILPAVIILHGGGGPMGSAQMMIDASGWVQKAEQEKFLAVFPNGTPHDSQKPVELSGNIQEWSD